MAERAEITIEDLETIADFMEQVTETVKTLSQVVRKGKSLDKTTKDALVEQIEKSKLPTWEDLNLP